MRRKIAEHMVLSKHTSAHVYSVFEVNYSTRRSDSQGEEGRVRAHGREARPSPPSSPRSSSTACAATRRSTPRSTATTSSITHEINLGIAVALENGLIVPVVKGAGEKNMLGLSRVDPGPRRSRAREEAEPRGSPRRHVHDHQPGHFRRAVRAADHQPAAGRDSRCRRDREARGRDRRRDRHPPDGLPDARLRPPPGRRRSRGSVHGRREEGDQNFDPAQV